MTERKQFLTGLLKWYRPYGHTAVVFKDKKYTYKELDEISDRLGKYIASRGIGTEDVVSILIPRCEYMAIAPMGVIKAGAAYQPGSIRRIRRIV